MERLSLHRLLILLAFFQLIFSSNAIPSSRPQRMLQGTQDLKSLNDNSPQNKIEGMIFSGRINLESDDYPPAGPNDRHTPKPPG